MDVVLVMFKADGSRRDFPVKRSRVVIGRSSGCDLRIPLSSVSRQHCEVVVGEDGITIRDMGSSNGTFRNDSRVQESAVEAGDVIRVGPVAFTLVVDGEPADVKPVKSKVRPPSPSRSSSVTEREPTESTEDDPIAALAAAAAEAEEPLVEEEPAPTLVSKRAKPAAPAKPPAPVKPADDDAPLSLDDEPLPAIEPEPEPEPAEALNEVVEDAPGVSEESLEPAVIEDDSASAEESVALNELSEPDDSEPVVAAEEPPADEAPVELGVAEEPEAAAATEPEVGEVPGAVEEEVAVDVESELVAESGETNELAALVEEEPVSGGAAEEEPAGSGDLLMEPEVSEEAEARPDRPATPVSERREAPVVEEEELVVELVEEEAGPTEETVDLDAQADGAEEQPIVTEDEAQALAGAEDEGAASSAEPVVPLSAADMDDDPIAALEAMAASEQTDEEPPAFPEEPPPKKPAPKPNPKR